ncbi:hypothetical protein [Corynebacterium rouxii]|uniref:Uncharacterized protein n=1 Tax=Corynebacterium rouxii TaxID=2719119 RepID=A0A6I8MBH5_9CORY|nr:hypothetical protein [Corynebacterium rouxii]VZH85270.1 hypothetical protein FRC0190_01244 [Corynebacterium rouxii]
MSHVDSLAAKDAPHLADAVHTVIRGVNLANVLYQGSVTKTVSTQATGFGLAVPTQAKKTAFTVGV